MSATNQTIHIFINRFESNLECESSEIVLYNRFTSGSSITANSGYIHKLKLPGCIIKTVSMYHTALHTTE